ncbi:MAG: hypothetical protein HY023_00360 [Chloroflexi bacterium]|nr:hypothetical protein [Chloroflexota bacterium]
MTATTVSTEAAARAPSAPAPAATVAEALAQFRVFRSRPLANGFAALPWAMLGIAAALEIALALSGQPFDLMFAIGVLAAALSIGLMGTLFAQFPRALIDLRHRNLLRAREADGDAAAETRLVTFLAESEALLNHSLGLLFGLAGTIVVVAVFWPFGVGAPSEWAEALARYPSAWLGVLFYLVVYSLGFGAGYLIWRPVALAIRLAKSGEAFEFDLSLENPDGCGGLKPLGDLGLGIALILAGPAIFLGGWAFALSAHFVQPRGLDGGRLPFAGLAALCAALALAGFFWPLWGVSRAMRRRRAQVRNQLDSLGRQIDQLAKSLLDNAERLDPAEGRAQEEKLEFLRRVYARNRRVPVWPFNAVTLLELLALQLVPLAGIIAVLILP